jgi:hypothetical protein
MKPRFIGVLSFCALALISPPSLSQIPTDGLVAYYPFNGNADDESGNGNHGVVHGAVLCADRFSNPNSAYEFDGTDNYVDLGYTTDLLLRGDLTLSAWVRLRETPSFFGSIIGKGGYGEDESTNQPFNFHVINSGETPHLRHSHEHGSGINTDVMSVRPLEKEVWMHAALVRNVILNTYRFYINGEPEGDFTYETDPTGGEAGVSYIGWSPTGSPGQGFDGTIDDLRIYDRPLTDDEILTLYHESPSTGLVAYYPFNGNADDESGNGNNGTILGGVNAAHDRFGNPGSAFRFDGSTGYITVPNSPSLQKPDSSVSVLAWVNVENWYNTWAGLVAKSESAARGQYALAFQDGGRIDVDVASTYVWFFTGLPFQPGQWYFAAYTWDGDTIRVYVNGELIDSKQYSIPPTVDSHPLELGRHTPGNTEYLDGTLDDVRIFDRALTGDEIQELFHEGGWPAAEWELVAHYPFNGNANDESGHGNDGTVFGATLTSDRFGNENSAYNFDGNDYINIGSDGSLLITQDLSVSVWVKMSDLPSWFAPIIGRGEWGETEPLNAVYALHVLNVGGQSFARHSHEHGDGINTDVISVRNLVEDQWIHVGIVRNSSQKKYRFYVNGTPEADVEYAFNPTGGWTTSGYIGWAPWGVTTYFQGVIDDIRVYSRVKSDSEMMDLYLENGWLTELPDPGASVPSEFSLGQNFPNPFNPVTTILFDLPSAAWVRLSVYDILGRTVAELLNEETEAGSHLVRFNAEGLASGTYLYRLEAGEFVETRKLVLLR